METRKQNRTSAATSINSKKLPAVYTRHEIRPRSVVFDIGCGKYTDHIRAALPGVAYFPYDPYNQPDDVNTFTKNIMDSADLIKVPVTVVCSNVLNVIDDDDALQAIAAEIAALAIKAGGRALITVYEGDRSGTGRETGPDQWQRNQRLRDYLPLFPAGRAHITKNTIVIE